MMADDVKQERAQHLNNPQMLRCVGRYKAWL